MPSAVNMERIGLVRMARPDRKVLKAIKETPARWALQVRSVRKVQRATKAIPARLVLLVPTGLKV